MKKINEEGEIFVEKETKRVKRMKTAPNVRETKKAEFREILNKPIPNISLKWPLSFRFNVFGK